MSKKRKKPQPPSPGEENLSSRKKQKSFPVNSVEEADGLIIRRLVIKYKKEKYTQSMTRKAINSEPHNYNISLKCVKRNWNKTEEQCIRKCSTGRNTIVTPRTKRVILSHTGRCIIYIN